MHGCNVFLLQEKEKVVLAPAGQAEINKPEKEGYLFAKGKGKFVKFCRRADVISPSLSPINGMYSL